MLSPSQRKIIETKEKYVVVMASVSAGKTLVLTERVRYLLKNGADPSKIVVITFTNAAAGEMKRRLGDDLDPRVNISTVHSYANKLLIQAGVDTAGHLYNEEFDELFPLIKKNPRVLQEVDHLLLDEAQDSDEAQMDFLSVMIKPKNFFFVGDVRQTIFSFNGADPEILLQIMEQNDVVTYDLNENYRNGRRIVEFAKRILRYAKMNDTSVPMVENEGHVEEIPYNKDDIAKIIMENGEYKKWFVLTRTNAELDEILKTLRDYYIPCTTFLKAQLKSDDLARKMEEDTVKVLTIHTAKGLENDYVIVVGARYYNPEEIRISYVAATRARKLLVWTNKPRRRKRY